MEVSKGTAKVCEEHDECSQMPTQAGKGPLSASLAAFIDDEAREAEGSDEEEQGSSSSSSSDSEAPKRKLERGDGWVAQENSDEEDLYGSVEQRIARWTILAAPDVGAYLSYLKVPPLDQIALCRTWANYLAAKNRPEKYKKAKK